MSETVIKSGHRSKSETLIAFFLRVFLAIYLFVIALIGLLPYRRKVGADGADVLLTGTFYSDNWLLAHVRPIGMSSACRSVQLVMTYEMESFGNVEVIVPPRWLRRVVGDVGARLIVFFFVALWRRPHFVGGFHLLFNGLVAGLVARLCGARSMYFCVGGPAEVVDGGLQSENRLFEKIGQPDKVIEKRLIAAVARFDQTVTMGTSAKRFYQEAGVSGAIDVISGGIDLPEVINPLDTRKYDVIFVGRIAPIKRIDIFVRMVALLCQSRPHFSAVIVGDGQQRLEAEALAKQLNVDQRIEFAGFQSDVASFFLQSKVFALTSDSEGLSLALMEAMAAGVVPVVSDVGDLGDIVENDNNGSLVDSRDPVDFAAAVSQYLDDSSRWQQASSAAIIAAESNSVAECSGRWENILNKDILGVRD